MLDLSKVKSLTNKQLLLAIFLISNSKDEGGEHIYSEDSFSRKDELSSMFSSCLGRRRLAKIEIIEQYLADKYDFEKYFRPLCEAGIISMEFASPGDFYDSSKYREAFKYTTGTCKNYSTGETWIDFWIADDKDKDDTVMISKLIKRSIDKGVLNGK